MNVFPPDPSLAPHVRRWCDRLRYASRQVRAVLDALITDDAKERYITTFRDEFGQRRPIDQPVLRRVLSLPAPMPAGDLPIDERLWWCLASREAFPPRILKASAGSLTTGFGREPIEPWTEREMRVLHAATDRAIEERDAPLLARVLDAADWLLDNIETDNATNRPWGVHAAIIRSAMGHSHAEHDAAGMIHAANAATGEADRLSQFIMLDAARTLDRWIE